MNSALLTLNRCALFKNCNRWSSLTNTIKHPATDEIQKQPFYLFPAPQVVVPSFELSRKVGNAFSQTIFRMCFEKSYSREGFLNGFMDAVAASGTYIANQNWDGLSRILTKDTVELVREARSNFDPQSVELLRFEKDDILYSFLYASLFSGKNVFKLGESGNMCIYMTAVAYIRTNNSVPLDASPREVLGKYKEDVFFANITFARSLNPLGAWKATAINFFQ